MRPDWPHHTLGDLGQPLTVFLHGFLGSGQDWRPVAERLSDRCYGLLPDLPGHGAHTETAAEAEAGLPQLATALWGWLDGLGVETVRLVGYSMGGRLALQAALLRPQRVSALVLEGAHPGLETSKARAERADADDARAQRLLDEGIDAFVDGWYEMDLFRSLRRRPDLLARVKAARKRTDPAEAARLLRGLSPGRQRPLWEQLPHLEAPTLLLSGELDAKYGKVNERARRLLPYAHAARIPDAGHNAHLENPGAVAEALGAFWAGV